MSFYVCRIISKEEKEKLAIPVILKEFKNKLEMHHFDQTVENCIIVPPSLDQPNEELQSTKNPTKSMMHKRSNIR